MYEPFENDDPKVNDIKTEPITILIEGRTYEVESIGAPYKDGSRVATLREVAPF